VSEYPTATSGAPKVIDVLDATGGKSGTAELPAELFDVTANIPLIHQVVVAQLAAARQGTHSTKTRGEVRGGGKKPYRQKGTGRARQGSTRAPQYVGGGVVHGPQPRGYAQRTPKKMIAAALRGALSDRARDGRVHVVTDLVSGDVPSTRVALNALATVASSPKVLVVLHRDDDLAWLSLRNAAAVHAIAVDQLNAYDVLVNDDVVFTSAALEAYVSGPTSGRSVKAVATGSEAADFEVTDGDATAVDTAVVAEQGSLEPFDELSAASVEGSAEPSNADLAATAASVAEVGEPVEVIEPLEAVEPTADAELAEGAEPRAEGDLK